MAEAGARQGERPLPALWVHRTPDGVFTGPLDGQPAPVRGGPQRDRRVATPLEILQVLTRADFRARYRAQALGVLWSLLYPLVMMSILSLIFARVFRPNVVHFPIFLLIGLICWQWVTNSLSAATQVFIQHADIIKRTVFARQLLPISSVLSHAINAAVESLVLLAFIPIFPEAFRLSPALLLVPVLLVLLAALLCGLGMATSVLNVIYRDVAYLVSTALLLLHWLTPVIYPPEVLPERYRSVLQWNPLGAILTALRRAIMFGEAPDLLGWATILLPTVAVCLAGGWIFRHYERMVLDYV